MTDERKIITECQEMATIAVSHMEDGMEKYHEYQRTFKALTDQRGVDPESVLTNEQVNSRFD